MDLFAKLRRVASAAAGAVKYLKDPDAGSAPCPGGAPNPGRGAFVHPGTLMGPREVLLLRRHVAEGAPPWAGAAAKLAADTPREYTPCPLADVHIDFDGVGRGHDEFVERDGRMVYMQAMMFLVSGDEQYAHNAARIMWAWASTNQTFTGQNAPLESGWGAASMARSAELLKHTWPGWHPQVEAALVRWLRRIILPNLRSEALERLPLGNWHTTVAEAKAQIAVLTGDGALWREATALWRRAAAAYLRPSGECAETQRDLYHSQFGFGGLVQTAELAWQQGEDLYRFQDCLILRALEFHAYITLGGVPPECCYPLRGIGFLPCGWEVALNHFQGRWGMPMPQTDRLLARSRPEGYVFHWGLGTLSHFGSAVELAAEDAAAAETAAATEAAGVGEPPMWRERSDAARAEAQRRGGAGTSAALAALRQQR